MAFFLKRIWHALFATESEQAAQVDPLEVQARDIIVPAMLEALGREGLAKDCLGMMPQPAYRKPRNDNDICLIWIVAPIALFDVALNRRGVLVFTIVPPICIGRLLGKRVTWSGMGSPVTYGASVIGSIMDLEIWKGAIEAKTREFLADIEASRETQGDEQTPAPASPDSPPRQSAAGGPMAIV
ncbi:hypothetical protein [Rhodovastum atsumiense]|uniref:Uncharacterized protein n=1 Tax=Rhodovastum atsumiense TaxID=504468 RepID=A0A5M6IPF2_9PROT|nr:hypothetical protein [Rhodovastum atsumiense]KAA5610152.1 hypothetical protein F1189_20670 [Rhodovastum atsumiense]